MIHRKTFVFSEDKKDAADDYVDRTIDMEEVHWKVIHMSQDNGFIFTTLLEWKPSEQEFQDRLLQGE